MNGGFAFAKICFADFYFDNTTRNLNDPKKFWKIVKSSFGDDTRDELPACIVNDAHTTLTEKTCYS